MEDIIWTIVKQHDEITLCGKNEYEVLISVGLQKSKDYSIILEFVNLRENDNAIVAMTTAPMDLEFRSKLLSKEGYNITNIAIMKFTMIGFQMIWECSSDDPTPLSNPPIK